MSEFVSRAEFGRRVGVTEAAVRKAIKRGLIKASPNGQLDFETCKALWEVNRDPDAAIKGILGGEAVRVNKPDAASGAAPSAPGPALPETSLLRARTANSVMQAQRQKLALEKEQGKLINTAAAIMACRAVITVVVERLDGAASQIAQRVVGLDVVATERIAREVLNDVRSEIARMELEVEGVASGGNTG